MHAALIQVNVNDLILDWMKLPCLILTDTNVF